MNLEDLYDLIDELLTVDMVTDAELGMHVRKWYEKQNQNDDDEWEDLMSEEMDWGDDDWD
jgi:hypothetical protein